MQERLTAVTGIAGRWLTGWRNQDTTELGQAGAQLHRALPTIKKIVGLLDPDLVPAVRYPSVPADLDFLLGAVGQAQGILADMDEWAVNLQPDAPSLVADRFHSNVWNAAAALWGTGEYRVAVGQAAASLSVHIASRVGSPLTERKLVQQVFSLSEPSDGQVRLHFSGDKNSDMWKSRQEGLHLTAQGAFAGIRNVAAHTNDDWTEQVALEHLAVLSVVARWADETELIKAR